MRTDLHLIETDEPPPIQARGVRALYLLLLTRWPEGDTAKRACEMSAANIIATIVTSSEFAQIVDESLVTGSLPGHGALGRKEADFVAAWLVETLGATIQVGFEHWAGMLHIILASSWFADFEKDVDFVDFRAHVARLDRLDRERNAPLQAYLRFDAEWFVRIRQGAKAAVQRRAGDVIDAVMTQAIVEEDIQILPAFSSGLENVFRPLRGKSAVALDDILLQTLACLRNDEVSHWLFDAEHYRWSLKAHSEKAGEGRTIHLNPYFDYLSRGEAEGFSPHPLFAGSVVGKSRSVEAKSSLLTFLQRSSPVETPSPLFDPNFYVSFNEGVTASIREGTVRSALEHFLCVGIFQDAPFSPDFDPAYYARRYPEIPDAVKAGTVPSLSWHFIFMGLKERRQPNAFFDPDYYRLRHPHVSEEMRRHKFGSELEHFLVMGRAKGWKCSEPLVTSRPSMRDAKALFQKRARRSYDTLLRRSRDLAPHRGVTPKISIVVPVCGEMEFTAHFLQCIYYALVHLAAVKDVAGEVVIVDNGSDDATPDLLSRCPGLVVARFDRPLGFPRAVNEGVKRSRGAVVVVANNDIEFAPDSLVTVLERMREQPEMGILGGVTILPDETIQEAGSFLDRHGNVTALGRGDDPWDPYHHGLHNADYCTGSFIAFRRDDFDHLGGFDEAFSPGYYEETDFALRMAKDLGKTVCVDSALQVVHFEHASFAKGRPPSYAAALIKKNQARLLQKHRVELARKCLARQPAAGGDHAPTALGRRRVLVIEDQIPDARLGSGFGRAADLLRALEAHDVAFDLLVLFPNTLVDDFADPRVKVHRAWMPGMDAERFVEENGGRYSHVLVCRTHNLRRFAAKLEQLRRREGVRIICDTEALGSLRRLEVDRLAGLAIGDAEEVAAVRDELDVGVLVAAWIAVSPRESEKMAEVGLQPVVTIGYGLPVGETTTVSGRFRILAVGAMHSAQSPNYDALVWFIDHVLPRLPALMEAMTFTIVGFWDQDLLSRFQRTYAHVRLEMRGAVSDDDLTRLYGESRVCIAPTRFAAGVPIKVLDAFSRGVPIIVTDLLARQILPEAVATAVGLAVAATGDEGEEFARWLTTLCLNDTAWTHIVEQQRLVVNEVAGMEAFEHAVEDLVRRELTMASIHRTAGPAAGIVADRSGAKMEISVGERDHDL